VVVTVLDARADASGLRGPQTVADPALAEGGHPSGRPVCGIARVEGVYEIEILDLDRVACGGYRREEVTVSANGCEGRIVLDPAKHVRYSGGVQKLSCKGTGYVLGELKTKQSPRTVRLTQKAVETLRSHRARQAQEKLRVGSLYQDQDLVFAGQSGGFINPSNLRQRSFAPLLKREGLPRITFHDLRHTCASLLFQNFPT
jgi:Phage integrase family